MEDLNKEIETWEEIKPENVGVYLSDKRDSINIDGYSDAIRSRYAYETNVQQMPKSDYVGMVRFNNEKTKRNPLTSAFRGAWSGLLQLPAGVDNAVTGLSEWITNAIYSGDIEAQKEISEAANALRQKNDAWLKEWSYQKDEKDSSFAFDFGQGGGSMFAAIGLSILTRNPNMAATMFGASQYGNLNKELREKGFDINYGNLTALVGGIAEGGLEKFGLHMWFENYASKKIGTFLIKQGATEFVQESSQQAAEEFIMRVSGGRVDGKSFSDVVSEVLYAGALGGMLGFVGGGVSIPATQAYKGRAQNILQRGGMSKDEASRYIEARLYGGEKEQKELQNKVTEVANGLIKDEATLRFKKLGIDEEQAKQMADDLLTNPEEVKASLIDTLNKEADFETLQNNSLEDDVKYFEEQRKKDIVKEAFEIEDKLKEDALAAGLSEEEADFRAKTEAAFAKRVWEETGITPLEYYENESTKIQNEQEGELIDESELSDEEIARLEAAEKARKQEEDIPFFQESLDVAKENARLDEQYPAYEGEAIDINGVQKTVYNSNGERIAKSAEALENFYRWFGDSKVVDKQGRPLVVYHGTKEKFNVFMGTKILNSSEGVGFNFADSKDVAEGFGEPMAVYLNLQNPVYAYSTLDLVSDTYESDFETENQEAISNAIYNVVEYLEQNGYTFYSEVNDFLSNLAERSQTQEILDGLLDLGGYIEEDYDSEKLYNDIRHAEINAFGIDGYITKNYNQRNSDVYIAFNPNQIKSTSNRGTYSESENIYYQPAFAGSGVDYVRPSLEAIGSGEGAQVHGWGLYYALDREVAEGYRERSYARREGQREHSLNADFETLTVNGKPLLDVYNIDMDRSIYNDLLYKPYGAVEAKIEERITQWEEKANDKDYSFKDYAKEKIDAYKRLKEDLFNNGMSLIKKDYGQVHEVDIPENPYLLDEQKTLGEQSPFVRKALKEVAKEVGVKWDSRYDNGKYIYDNIANVLGSKKSASQLLEKYGIKGITYYGQQDGRCFVIFNPDDVKVIQKFYQGENNPRASYQPISRLIHLFKTADHSSLVHELGHHFTMRYVKLLEENGRMDKLEGFYKWLGINDISEATTETWEQMARGFETYVMEGVAPNIDTENIFQKFKRFLIDIYNGLKPEQINDDVRQFFDKMLAGEEEMPDITGLEGKIEHIGEVIKGALKGEEVNFEGLSMDDLKKLTKLAHMRRPRKPKSLKQKIRSAGGIDIELAKSLGIYDSKKGNEGGFFKNNGEFTREDSLIEFLQSAGYLTGDMDTYENMAEVTDKAIDLIERADNVYTAEEQQIMETRDAIEAFAYDAFKKLGDIKTDDIYKAMKVLKKYDLKAVDKNTLQYLNARIKEVDRLQKQALKDLKQATSDKQAQLIDYIKKLPINAQDKLKIMERLKRAKLVDEFEDVLNRASELAKEFYQNEKRKMLSDMIDKEVKSSKPKQVTKQKYDYANNKLFKDLRDYSKMTQEQASDVLAKSEINDEITPENLVRMHYLNYKANGAKTSTEMLEQVYADLVIAKQQGIAAKDEADFEKSMNREAVRQEIIDAIDANNADKNSVKTRIGNLYRKGLTNLYSLINSISSKKLADAFEMETVLNRAQVKYHKQTEALKEKAFKVYNVKSAGDLLNRFADMGKTIGHLYNVDGIKAEEISIMKLVDIYNAMKNEKTRQDYIDNYGEEQLDRLLSYLTPQDIAFADLMMEDINSLFPEVNKTYIKIYGMDLLKVENYWPATSEHTTETSLLGDYYSQQTTPSSWKERVKGKVTPIPQNAWTKYLKHINENIYMINTAEKYKELATVFKSKRIRNKITNKFGAGVYNELMKQISALSLNAKSDSLNYIESAFGSILNNFVVAKIAVAPTVFAGQLTSITNYAENVKSSTFYKNFAEGLAHPKQTIKFMKEAAGDFLEARYKGGYAESISNVLSEAEDAMSQKFRLISPKTKYNTANALSSFVRMGDIGAIIFGGYGQIKSNIEAGMSMEEAIKRFEFDTLRSQQSSIKASLGSFQQSKGIARMFLAFKNTQHQYFRKIADAVINLQRGEISSKEAAKIIGNYALIQTTLYVMAKNLVNAGLGLLDDDDKITDGVLEQILLGTIDAIPFLSDMLHFAYRRLSGQYSPNLLSMVGIDDIQRSINKFYKQEKNVYDYVEIITPLIEGTTSLPVQRFERMFKKYTEE